MPTAVHREELEDGMRRLLIRASRRSAWPHINPEVGRVHVHAPMANERPVAAMEGVEGRLRLDVSQDEEEFGFEFAEDPSGVRAVVRELRPGLRAVKVEADDGSIEYAICGENLQPVYRPAKTIEELKSRFPFA